MVESTAEASIVAPESNSPELPSTVPLTETAKTAELKITVIRRKENNCLSFNIKNPPDLDYSFDYKFQMMCQKNLSIINEYITCIVPLN